MFKLLFLFLTAKLIFVGRRRYTELLKSAKNMGEYLKLYFSDVN